MNGREGLNDPSRRTPQMKQRLYNTRDQFLSQGSFMIGSFGSWLNCARKVLLRISALSFKSFCPVTGVEESAATGRVVDGSGREGQPEELPGQPERVTGPPGGYPGTGCQRETASNHRVYPGKAASNYHQFSLGTGLFISFSRCFKSGP